MYDLKLALLAVLSTSSFTSANIFEQMFGGGGHQQQQQAPQNAPSTGDAYRNNYFGLHCDQYLCPDTLACVSVPHHCPCAHPGIEDKVELGDGVAICASKGGFKEGEMKRKVELARKGLL